MQSTSTCKNKVYTSSWCISGEKLTLLENPRKCYTSKQISITSAPKFSFDEQKSRGDDRKNGAKVILQLNQKDYDTANNLLNRQLKHIYETVKVEDFERILGNFCMSSAYRQLPLQNNDILRTIDAENIYEYFFGRHYNFLEGIANDS